jgi:hypothetical protein
MQVCSAAFVLQGWSDSAIWCYSGFFSLHDRLPSIEIVWCNFRLQMDCNGNPEIHGNDEKVCLAHSALLSCSPFGLVGHFFR